MLSNQRTSNETLLTFPLTATIDRINYIVLSHITFEPISACAHSTHQNFKIFYSIHNCQKTLRKYTQHEELMKKNSHKANQTIWRQKTSIKRKKSFYTYKCYDIACYL